MTHSTRNLVLFGELPRIAVVNLTLLAAAVLALTFRLWPDWVNNPDLSHGFFMPLVFAILLHEARQGTPRFLRSSAITRIAFAALLIVMLLGLIAAGLYAAAVDWTHPLVNFSLSASVIAVLSAGLILFANEGVRVVGFNWNALSAIVLWVLCTPIPPGTYQKLTVTLQLWVSEGVLRVLHMLGIAAVRHGNIIELARTTVGVEEACSGIRSLISCVFAGVFFSATLVRRPWARVLIIGLSAPLALLMNFVRSLTLTLLSNNGVDISGKWHDLTGFAVLAITAALLAGLAVVLERAGSSPVAPHAPAPTDPPCRSPRAQHAVLVSTFGIAAALVVFSAANTRPTPRSSTPAPDLAALLPASASGWTVSASDDLYKFRDQLKTEQMAQRSYRKTGSDGRTTEIIVYAAYWKPGAVPVSLVAAHTPDACWPGSGWTAKPVKEPRVILMSAGRILPEAEYRVFTLDGFPQHVWFWHLYDGRPIAFRDPYSAIELLQIAWRYGFQHRGDQLFVRVSSNRPWSELANEPLLAELFRRSQQLGL